MALIEMKNVTKEFKTLKRQKGILNIIKSIISKEFEIKKAVDNISLSIDRGELVGYIGPNGAGKSTTVKMLSGILTPSAGKIFIDGMVPHENRKENAMKIGVVFGQRSQLYWDLPMEDTFQLYKKMYKVDDKTYRRNVDFYVELLEMQEFLHRPVRQLSLGQKMRGNLAIALLHDPNIVYLDEPTIGLDVVAKSNIRKFIREINKEKNTTVILTTHDMDDIEQICSRLVMIDQGRVIYDGSLDSFKVKYGSEYVLAVDFEDENTIISDPRLKVIKEQGRSKHILFDKRTVGVANVIVSITQNYKITDISIKEADIEDVVREIYINNKITENKCIAIG